MNILKTGLSSIAIILALSTASANAQTSNYEVGPGEYSQHYSGGGVRNFTVPDGETHTIDVQEGDTLTRRDPDTGEVTYFEAK